MARNSVFLSPHNFKQKRSQIQLSLTFLIVAVFKRNSVEFPRFLSLNLRERSLISSDSQRLIEIIFVVQLQTLHQISHRKNNFGAVNR